MGLGEDREWQVPDESRSFTMGRRCSADSRDRDGRGVEAIELPARKSRCVFLDLLVRHFGRDLTDGIKAGDLLWRETQVEGAERTIFDESLDRHAEQSCARARVGLVTNLILRS